MIIEKFTPKGGHHCITNSLKQIFEYNGYQISEDMLFGLGSGLGFVYINLANAPMISCRIKPIEFEINICERLEIGIAVKKPKNTTVAFEKLVEYIKREIPVMLYVDMPFLNYLNMQNSGHFGGHSVVIFGFDDKEECFYVSDRDNSDWKIHTPEGEIGSDYYKVSYKEIEKARNSKFRPFPANNKWLDFNFTLAKNITKNVIIKALEINIESMLNAPANLLGIKGIYKFAKEIRKWEKFDVDKRKLSGITNYFMISFKGGTGGGAFRKMYGNFLIEASEITKLRELENCGKNYLQIANLWDNIATEMMELYNSGNEIIIKKLPSMIIEIADKEKKELEKIKSIIINKY